MDTDQSVRKSVRKSVKNSVRKSVKNSVRKSVKKSVRKSVRKSGPVGRSEDGRRKTEDGRRKIASARRGQDSQTTRHGTKRKSVCPTDCPNGQGRAGRGRARRNSH